MAKELNSMAQEELAEVAKRDLNENPARIKEDIKHIQDWLKKQPHLAKSHNLDEGAILLYLRGCKFSLQRTKEKIDMYFTCKAACPEWFGNLDPKDPVLEDLLNLGMNVPLKGFDKHGRAVMLMQGGVTNPSKHSFNDQIRFSLMMGELMLCMHRDQPSIMGMVGVQNLSGITMGHATQFTPSAGKKMMTVWQDGFPQRPKGMHFLNMPTFMEGIFKLMTSFANEKMRKRFIVHTKGDLTKLHEEVGTEVLPEELGGTNGKIQDHIEHLRELLMANRKYLKESGKYKAIEKKRPGKPKTHSDLFGMEGSFRQLEFD